jgi:hypothetical protein
MKTFTVTRIVLEMYQVSAESKQKAKTLITDPYSVTVIKETIKQDKK